MVISAPTGHLPPPRLAISRPQPRLNLSTKPACWIQLLREGKSEVLFGGWGSRANGPHCSQPASMRALRKIQFLQYNISGSLKSSFFKQISSTSSLTLYKYIAILSTQFSYISAVGDNVNAKVSRHDIRFSLQEDFVILILQLVCENSEKLYIVTTM